MQALVGSRISFSELFPPPSFVSLLSSVSKEGQNSHGHSQPPSWWERGCLGMEGHSSHCQGEVQKQSKGCVKPHSGLQTLASVLLSVKKNALPSSLGYRPGREGFCKHSRCGSPTQRDQQMSAPERTRGWSTAGASRKVKSLAHGEWRQRSLQTRPWPLGS